MSKQSHVHDDFFSGTKPKMFNAKKFAYNKSTGEVFGRNAESWGKNHLE